MDEQVAQLQLRASNLRRFKPQALISELDTETALLPTTSPSTPLMKLKRISPSMTLTGLSTQVRAAILQAIVVRWLVLSLVHRVHLSPRQMEPNCLLPGKALCILIAIK